MNERIRELATRARYDSTIEKCYLEEIHNREITPVEYQDIYDKRFAELIVGECVSQCWSVSELEHKGRVLSECSKRMRKHFGVKE